MQEYGGDHPPLPSPGISKTPPQLTCDLANSFKPSGSVLDCLSRSSSIFVFSSASRARRLASCCSNLHAHIQRFMILKSIIYKAPTPRFQWKCTTARAPAATSSHTTSYYCGAVRCPMWATSFLPLPIVHNLPYYESVY